MLFSPNIVSPSQCPISRRVLTFAGLSEIFFPPIFPLVSLFTFFGAILLYKITDFIIPLRVSEDSEKIGLDLSQHGENLTI